MGYMRDGDEGEGKRRFSICMVLGLEFLEFMGCSVKCENFIFYVVL